MAKQKNKSYKKQTTQTSSAPNSKRIARHNTNKTARKVSSKNSKVSNVKIKQSKDRRSKITKRKHKIYNIKLHLTKNTDLTFSFKLSPAKKSKKNKTRINLIRRKLVTIFLIVTGMVGITTFSYQLAIAQFDTKKVNTNFSTIIKTYKIKSLVQSDAVKLIVPSIGVNADVVIVGKNPDNTIEVPSNPKQAGQYINAPTPGEIGPSIIVGHVDSVSGPGVFWKLNELLPGQLINVKRQNGSEATFEVEKIEQFDQDKFPTDLVYGNSKKADLRLITCGGTFNILKQSYTKNTVVFATLK